MPETTLPAFEERMRPVQSDERIQSVDVLRGFSVLGILLLNIVAFGLPFAAYMNPSVYGGDTGANLSIWLVAITFWDGKLRAIFTMLFGTSALILLSRAEQRGAGIEAADIYYRRTLWLIAIGLFHAHLIWSGDILYGYGVVGLLLFPLRKLSSRALLIAGAVVVLLHTGQNIGGGYAIGEMAKKAAEAEALTAKGETLSDEQKKTVTEYEALRNMFAPPQKAIEEDLKAHRGGWVENLKLRSSQSAKFQFTLFFQFLFLDVLGMLLLGMGLAKASVFDASRGYRFYAMLVLLGFGIGAPLNYWAARQWHASGFGIPEYFTYLGSTADVGRFLVAGAYIGLVMMVCKAGVLGWITGPLAAVGRTALSNYLLTSVLLTLLFNGYGFGLFGKLQRFELYGVVLGMWVINLVASPLWLRYYRFGPAEWAWRSLTYWKRQPMRKQQAELGPRPPEPEQSEAVGATG